MHIFNLLLIGRRAGSSLLGLMLADGPLCMKNMIVSHTHTVHDGLMLNDDSDVRTCVTVNQSVTRTHLSVIKETAIPISRSGTLCAVSGVMPGREHTFSW
jgi:hypothetical protein